MTGTDDPFFSKYDEYDCIISLGGCCSTAMQLVHRGKRAFSLPFDWTLMVDVRPIEYLVEGFRNRFADFMQWENMYEYEPPSNEYGKLSRHVEDGKTGFRFMHLFYGNSFERKMFESGRAVMKKRISRLYAVVEKSRRVMFCLHTVFPYAPSIAEKLRKTLVEVFPNVEIELRIMQFGDSIASTMIKDDGLLRIYTSHRKHNIVYDNQLTGPEWCWMDELRIRGMLLPEEVRKSSLWVKWKFKLWRHLGKSLQKDGAGVASVRFRQFGHYDLW